jgi:hypothetical protein
MYVTARFLDFRPSTSVTWQGSLSLLLPERSPPQSYDFPQWGAGRSGVMVGCELVTRNPWALYREAQLGYAEVRIFDLSTISERNELARWT